MEATCSSFLSEGIEAKDFILPKEEQFCEGNGGYGELLDPFPEIDLSQPDELLLPLIQSASASWGFFRLLNHGIPHSLLHKISSLFLQIFHLPLHQKLRILKTSDIPLGYIGSSQTVSIKSWCEALHFMPGVDQIRELLQRVLSSPEECQTASSDVSEYMNLTASLAKRILDILFRGDDSDPHDVTRLFETNTSSTLRANHYPSCPVADLTFGSPPHKDFGGLSILYQDDVGGLEVLKEGEWFRVKPEKGVLIVNVGEIVQVLSNMRYKSVLHRSLVHTHQPRLSFVFFYNPREGTQIAPAPKFVSLENPAKYRPFLWEDYRSTFQKAKINGHSPTVFFESTRFPSSQPSKDSPT